MEVLLPHKDVPSVERQCVPIVCMFVNGAIINSAINAIREDGSVGVSKAARIVIEPTPPLGSFVDNQSKFNYSISNYLFEKLRQEMKMFRTFYQFLDLVMT